MQIEVYIGEQHHKIEAEPGQSILEALQIHGINVLTAPCGGKGRCGKCKVLAEGMGEVLACTTSVESGMKVTIPQQQLEADDAKIAEDGWCSHYPPDQMEQLVAACDIGTTTVVCHLIDGMTGEKLATVSAPSAQRGFGADVLSRIQAAEAGHLMLLRDQITGQIRQMLETLKKESGRSEEITRLSVVGNTIMCHLFAGISPAAIGVTPFMPQEFFGKEYTGEELGLSECKRVYIAPAVAGFVGGDITADLLSVMTQQEGSRKTLLLDIGTNGEMALGDKNQYYCCATAIGSAFEGAEMKMGMPAAAGAISHVWLDKRRIRVEVIGGGTARGICGSGLVDALAVLLEMGLLDHTGLLNPPDAVSVAYRKYLGEYAGQPCVWLSKEVCLTQEDIRGLQLAKAAFAAGMKILWKESHIAADEIGRVVLAGGFGSYLKKESAAAIGLVPKELLPVTVSVGNAAGEGAVSAAISEEARKELMRIRERMHYIELSTHPEFAKDYMQQMDFDVK